MYIEDVAEFARVLLTTTDMTFTCGWPRIELLLFCQLASITGSRPQSLLDLRYRHLQLNLIRDPDGGRPRLFIYLTPEFTKTFLGKKEPYVSPPLPLFLSLPSLLPVPAISIRREAGEDVSCAKTKLIILNRNTFPIPEIIYDPTLALSPHVFLLGMLFRIGAFKNISQDGPTVNCPENLYNLGILNGLNQQELKLKDEILDQFVFCQAIREADGVRIALDQQLSAATLRYRMKRGGEITGFEQVTKPYGLRYGAAKAFNDSRKQSPLPLFPLSPNSCH